MYLEEVSKRDSMVELTLSNETLKSNILKNHGNRVMKENLYITTFA